MSSERPRPTLEDAILLATEVHRGQKDKGGAPYILHPLRVMLRVAGDTEQMAAVLHDVVEDTWVTLEQLRKDGYPEAVVRAVDCLSRRKDEDYDAFVARINPNAVARRVKLADLEDNMDLSRIPAPTDKDRKRVEKYRRYFRELSWQPRTPGR